jgi:hypothetical protein
MCLLAFALSAVASFAPAEAVVGGSITGVTPSRVVCRNITTQQRVVIQNSAAAWDCEAAGLQVSPGDTVIIRVYGTVQDVEDATIEFTYVPPLGSFDNLEGQVLNVDPVTHRIAVYIKVGSGWWTKPYWSSPLTAISVDGSWTCDITTGGIDEWASEIVAFLVPVGYNPPLMSGGGTLPADLDLTSVAKVSISR